MEIYHEIISTVILLPSADSRRVVDSYMRKYMCTKYWLTALSKACPEKDMVRFKDHPDFDSGELSIKTIKQLKLWGTVFCP